MREARTRRLVVIFGVALGVVLPCLAANTTITYTFNTADQLTQVSSSDYGTLAAFTYDGDGQRITKTVGSQTTIYVRGDAGEVIAEYSGTGTLLAEYVYLDGQRVCKITKDGQSVEHRVYYHADLVGTPVVLTDESGNLISKAEYYPFGEEVVPGAAPDLHMFTGKEMDDETGLYYFGARYYDSELARFISVDPAPPMVAAGRDHAAEVGAPSVAPLGRATSRLSSPQSLNRYTYSLNNPLRYLDENGQWPTEVHNQIITAAFSTGHDALPEGVRAIFMRASAAVDSETQDPVFSYLHAMRAGYQSPEQARAQMENFIADKVREFRELISQGEKEEAYFALGEAMHPLMDSTSPAHEGFQTWTGVDALHVLRETNGVFHSKPEYLQQSVQLVRGLYEQATAP